MIGTLYRYPHPHDPTKFIYCGQGPKRDKKHRSGESSFGRRFKRDFLDVELPQPIRKQVEVRDQLELNELETIWMFQYHTWCGYPDGMNLIFPGSTDYAVLGRIGGPIGGPIGGRNQPHEAKIFGGHIQGCVQGPKNVESGHLARIRSLPQTKAAQQANAHVQGCIQGPKNVENGQLARISGFALHTRWHVNRGIKKPGCKLCENKA